MKRWFMNWLSEKTTWMGFASVAAALGANFDPNVQAAVVGVAVSFFAMPDAQR